MQELDADIDICAAYERIRDHINSTPLLHLEVQNPELFRHKILFKTESLQKCGSFKIRGILNNILYMHEHNIRPEYITTYSTGNHAISLAWACKHFNFKAKIFVPSNISPLKLKIMSQYGAEIVITETRTEAEFLAHNSALEPNILFISPSQGDLTLSGAGTVAYEALQMHEFDALFAPCGGGGLVCGTNIARKLLQPKAKVFATEPLDANDIALSLRENKIYRFTSSPNTIADGVRTLSITPKIFSMIKELDGIYEISEEEILYWCSWLMQRLNIVVEPSAALAMAGAYHWLKTQEHPKSVLIILSGGNVDTYTHQKIWQHHKELVPEINLG